MASRVCQSPSSVGTNFQSRRVDCTGNSPPRAYQTPNANYLSGPLQPDVTEREYLHFSSAAFHDTGMLNQRPYSFVAHVLGVRYDSLHLVPLAGCEHERQDGVSSCVVDGNGAH